MMDVPLTTWTILARASDCYASSEIVSRSAASLRHVLTYAEMSARSQQLMHGLDRLGVSVGGVVGTLAWNSHRHLEAYFAAPCSRRILHTLNVRLSSDDLAYIINSARDEVILADPDFLPLLESIRDRIPTVKHMVVFPGELPSPSRIQVIPYEDLLADQLTVYPRPSVDENEVMGLCYTSGTTGRPKGVPYTHRSTFLNALGVTSTAGMAVGPQDCVLPIVPMFHAAAWGMPYASTMVGSKQAFFAGPLEPAAVLSFIEGEEVTVSAAVPSVWLALTDAVRARPHAVGSLRHIICGGSQPSAALMETYENEFGVPIIQAWGMTETSPLAAAAWPQHRMRNWSRQELAERVRSQAGTPLPGIEIEIRDASGEPVPPDGSLMGTLYVRGPWVTDRYFGGETPESFAGGWFNTGDVAIASQDGFFVIADRVKDLIKSGGEWISSVAMEGALMAMSTVHEAAVVGVPDDKWGERPVVCVVAHPAAAVTIEEIRVHLADSGFPRWQLPDQAIPFGELPKTAVGKIDKKALRASAMQSLNTLGLRTD